MLLTDHSFETTMAWTKHYEQYVERPRYDTILLHCGMIKKLFFLNWTKLYMKYNTSPFNGLYFENCEIGFLISKM